MPFETGFVTLGTVEDDPQAASDAGAPLVHEGGTILVDCGEAPSSS